MAAATSIDAKDYGQVKIRLKTAGGTLSDIHFRWKSYGCSEEADRFNAPIEVGRKVYESLMGFDRRAVERADGFREYALNLAGNPSWCGRLMYIEIRLHGDPKGPPALVHLQQLWFTPVPRQ